MKHPLDAIHPALVAALFAAPLLSSCELDVVPNRDSVPESSAIVGDVTVVGAVTGDVVLALYDCDDPPPPEGTGRPVDLVVVPRIEFDKGQAPFTFPLVAAGEPGTELPDGACYLLTGFLDADHDFNPFYGVTGQVTGGDVVADAVVVVVPGRPDEDSPIPLVEGVSVVIETAIPFDRPSFVVTPTHTSTGIDPCGAELPAGAPLAISVGQDTDFLLGYDLVCARVDALALDTPLVDVSDPAFGLVFAPDGDGDGLPDDINGDTYPDVLWPRVLFLRLDPTDETLLTTVDPPVVIPGVVLPQDPHEAVDDNHLLAYLTAGLPLDGETAYPVSQLNVVIPERVVTDADAVPPTTELLDVVAGATEVSGVYQVLVMNSTGQLWQTPNELAQYGITSQTQALVVAD